MIYFIQAGDDGPVKIGFSRDAAGVEKRRRELQTAHFVDLHVRNMLEGELVQEAALHGLFAGDRLRGEWFRVTPLLEWCMFGPSEKVQSTVEIATRMGRLVRAGIVDRDGRLSDAGRWYVASLEARLGLYEDDGAWRDVVIGCFGDMARMFGGLDPVFSVNEPAESSSLAVVDV